MPATRKRKSTPKAKAVATKKARTKAPTTKKVLKKQEEPSPESAHVDDLAAATNISEVHTEGAESPPDLLPDHKSEKGKRSTPKKRKVAKIKTTSRKKLKFRRGKTTRSFSSGSKSKAFIDNKKFASLHPTVRKLLSSKQLFGPHQWKLLRFACEGGDTFSQHSASNYNAGRALELEDSGLCTRIMNKISDGDFRPFEDGSSGVSKKKLEKKPDTSVSELHFDGTMADAEAATAFLQTIGEELFLFNTPALFCKGFWKTHLKVAHEEIKPTAAAATMVETPLRAGIIGAPDAEFVKDFRDELLELNKGDRVGTAWIKARAAALLAHAKASADPESFDLAADTAEARKLFSELKALSKSKEHKKDRRFSSLSEWKMCGMLRQDPDDPISVVPAIELPSTVDVDEDDFAEDEEGEEGEEGVEDDHDTAESDDDEGDDEEAEEDDSDDGEE